MKLKKALLNLAWIPAFAGMTILFAGMTIPYLSSSAYADSDILIKDRKQMGKAIRVRMPPQVVIDEVQKQFQNNGPYLNTFWQTFVVEDDEKNDEFVIVARSVERPWAFGLMKQDCPKPENYDNLRKSALGDGSEMHIDMLIGVKKERSFFRYVINVYQPMYLYWTNPCYAWIPTPKLNDDPFYKKNPTMALYAQKLGLNIYELVKTFEKWKAPSKYQKIAAMKGPAQELLGGGAEDLTDEQLKLPLQKQIKILEKMRKEREKEEKKKEKEEEKKNKRK